MGYEIKIKYHPKKTEGIGYDSEILEEETKKVGKPFDDTGLEKLAGAVMAQLARRDVMVVDLEIDELVRRSISFKEASDGKGIILKNKKFSLDQTAKLVASDFVEVPVGQPAVQQPTQPQQFDLDNLPEGMQPHEVMAMQRQSQNIDNLYSDPNANLPVRKQNPQNRPKVDQNKTIYHVIFDPGAYMGEAKKANLKFTPDEKYRVHALRENPLGGQFGNLLSITDDTGKVVELDEKFFCSCGQGLYADELGFSESTERKNEPKLSYSNESYYDVPEIKQRQVDVSQIPPEFRHIPLDDGSIPVDNMDIPDIRPGQKF